MGMRTCSPRCIRTWLTRHERWGSPLYIVGESYGTTRAAVLAEKLQNWGVALSGLVLVSCAMDLQTLVFTPGNELPYALFLPAFACRGPVPRQAQGAHRGVGGGGARGGRGIRQ